MQKFHLLILTKPSASKDSIGNLNEICLYKYKDIFIMQISFFAKIVFILAIYCISDLSIKNNIIRKVINRANKAKKV